MHITLRSSFLEESRALPWNIVENVPAAFTLRAHEEIEISSVHLFAECRRSGHRSIVLLLSGNGVGQEIPLFVLKYVYDLDGAAAELHFIVATVSHWSIACYHALPIVHQD